MATDRTGQKVLVHKDLIARVKRLVDELSSASYAERFSINAVVEESLASILDMIEDPAKRNVPWLVRIADEAKADPKPLGKGRGQPSARTSTERAVRARVDRAPTSVGRKN